MTGISGNFLKNKEISFCPLVENDINNKFL